MSSLRSWLYLLARVLGDVEAVRRGTIIQRLARRALYRRAGSIIQSIIPPKRRR